MQQSTASTCAVPAATASGSVSCPVAGPSTSSKPAKRCITTLLSRQVGKSQTTVESSLLNMKKSSTSKTKQSTTTTSDGQTSLEHSVVDLTGDTVNTGAAAVVAVSSSSQVCETLLGISHVRLTVDGLCLNS